MGKSTGRVAALGAAKQASRVHRSRTPATGCQVPPALRSRKAGTARTTIAAAPPAWSGRWPTWSLSLPRKVISSTIHTTPTSTSTSAKPLERFRVSVRFVQVAGDHAVGDVVQQHRAHADEQRAPVLLEDRLELAARGLLR
ncbi:hypothetical protein GCM10010279_26750 [Streptomyces mutabilis]|nr:hypothetical protein GCM10010279_26750 [Streptomyces mutabilis]